MISGAEQFTDWNSNAVASLGRSSSFRGIRSTPARFECSVHNDKATNHSARQTLATPIVIKIR